MIVEGDIRTLIDWENYEKCDTSDASFKELFKFCINLIDASNLSLSITDLGWRCYEEMFLHCTNLLKGPKVLPAKKLSNRCYKNMFYNCKSLQYPPEILAETYTSYSMDNMFYGCDSLQGSIKLNMSFDIDDFKSLFTKR